MFSTIPTLISHVRYGQFTLTQTIKSWKIGQALIYKTLDKIMPNAIQLPSSRKLQVRALNLVHEIAGVLRGAADGFAFSLFRTIPLLISHFKYGQITLVEIWKIGHALSSLSFGRKLVKSNLTITLLKSRKFSALNRLGTRNCRCAPWCSSRG